MKSNFPTVNQNTIVAYLEDVIPQMQKSASAEDCLLKYAHDHNFSPAILERVGHMFNSLKVNSTYNMAKQASHRGDYVSTLDVPSLLEKYQDLAKDLDYEKLQTACNTLSSLNPGEAMAFKLASENKPNDAPISNEGSVKDLFVNVQSEEIDFANELVKAFHDCDEELKNETKKQASTTSKDFYIVETLAYTKLLKDTMQGYSDLKEEYIQKAASISDKFKSIYGTSTPLKYASVEKVLSFNELERDAILSYTGNDLNAFKASISNLADYISGSVKKIARATESDFKYVKIVKEIPSLQKDLEEYHESLESIKLANTGINAILKLIDQVDPFSHSTKVAATTTTMDPAVQAQLNAIADKLKALEAAYNTYNADAVSLQQKLLNSQNDILNLSKKNKDALGTKDTSYLKAPVSSASPDIPGLAKDTLNPLIDTTTDLGKKIISMPSDLLAETQKGIGSLYTMYRDTPEGVSPKQMKALSKMQEVNAKAKLEELLYMDPILSKLDDTQLDDLLDVYNSIVSNNPAIALDKGVLKTLLRRAVESSGIDLGTVESLSKIVATKNKK